MLEVVFLPYFAPLQDMELENKDYGGLSIDGCYSENSSKTGNSLMQV